VDFGSWLMAGSFFAPRGNKRGNKRKEQESGMEREAGHPAEGSLGEGRAGSCVNSIARSIPMNL